MVWKSDPLARVKSIESMIPRMVTNYAGGIHDVFPEPFQYSRKKIDDLKNEALILLKKTGDDCRIKHTEYVNRIYNQAVSDLNNLG